jgi:uncharacterized DUF497 family protein
MTDEFRVGYRQYSKTLRERGIGFDDGARIFAGRVMVWRDHRKDYGEARFRAVGESENFVLHVVYTARNETIRIILARRANRKETLAWQSQE